MTQPYLNQTPEGDRISDYLDSLKPKGHDVSHPFLAAGLGAAAGVAIGNALQQRNQQVQQLQWGYGLDTTEQAAYAQANPGIYQAWLYQQQQALTNQVAAQQAVQHKRFTRALWKALLVLFVFCVVAYFSNGFSF